MHGRCITLLATLSLLAGCTEKPTPEPPAQQAATNPGAEFDAAATGTIAGRVVWHGTQPVVPRFTVLADPENLPPDGKRIFSVPNPYAPRLDSTGGLGDVVVCLRGVAPRRAAPWPHGPVRIEQRERRLHVLQDGAVSRVGFVRAGDEIEAVNCDREYHALRVRGAAFFTLPFVEPNQVTRRRLERTGLVELMSGTSYFWMHAKLFVADHPYYARTNSDGRFRLDHVPPGQYEVVCWVPSWVVVRKERDPESALICRLVFAPALEQVASVDLREREASEVNFAWNEGTSR